MKLAFVAHSHQPVGNFDSVIADAVDRAYAPFLDVIDAVPEMRVGLHYSGSLLTWITDRRPEMHERLQALDDRVEWLTGGMYEPIMASLTDAWQDRQIQRHRRLLDEMFGAEPTGIWLAERIWQPAMAALIRRHGLTYTLADESLFEVGGANPRRPAVVEHLGQTTRVLPVSRELRHLIPITSTENVLAALHRIHEHDPEAVVVAADDGEKLGAWNDSHRRVYETGWLRELFTALVEAPWIELLSPHDAAMSTPERAVIGAGAYSEMNVWLTTPGGAWPAPWTRFLVTHPEANVMYRKMLTLAEHPKLSDDAINHIMAGQTNDAYWHGTFGGIYLPHLRDAVQTNLIEARKHIDGGHRTRSWCDLNVADWDCDGAEEIHVELPDQSWVLHSGGAFHYYDDKPGSWSVSNVISTDGAVPRHWLRDRFTPTDSGPECLYTPHDGPLIYELETAETSRGSVAVQMAGHLPGGGSVLKALRAHDREVEVRYEFEDIPEGRFGPELPVSVWQGAARLRVDGGDWSETVGLVAESGHRFRFQHIERAIQVVVNLRLPGAIYVAPLITDIESETGAEAIFQGVVLWPHFLVEGSGSYTVSVTIQDVEEG